MDKGPTGVRDNSEPRQVGGFLPHIRTPLIPPTIAARPWLRPYFMVSSCYYPYGGTLARFVEHHHQHRRSILTQIRFGINLAQSARLAYLERKDLMGNHAKESAEKVWQSAKYTIASLAADDQIVVNAQLLKLEIALHALGCDH